MIGNLNTAELMIVAVVAILIFGRRLPQVAGQGAAQLARARRSLQSLWRDTGLEQEVRSVQREIQRIERKLPEGLSRPTDFTPAALARRAGASLRKDVEESADELDEALRAEPQAAEREDSASAADTPPAAGADGGSAAPDPAPDPAPDLSAPPRDPGPS